MLHENPLMADIDVDHWRNLQYLLLDSAKEKRRIILIHEDGELQKFVHSDRVDIVKSIDRIQDPHVAAETVYRDNADLVDFVAVFERRAFDSFFGAVQDTWKADEDLDEFVHRTYAMMDDYKDGIVTYPGPARTTLGLQWRLGAAYEDIKSAVQRFVPPRSSVVFGVFDGDSLWTTLVLGFDADQRIDVVTTVDPSELKLDVQREVLVDQIVKWVDKKYQTCSVALFTDLEGAKEFLASKDKLEAVRLLISKGAFLSGPLTTRLAELLPV